MTEHSDDYLLDFQLISAGLVYASVCTSLEERETTDRLNLVWPTGLSYGWAPAEDETFATGQTNPCKCEMSPETHRHVLYSC